MKYCSHCGRAVSRCLIAAGGRERYLCRHCGMTHYRNPRVVVRCIVQLGDKILMCQRANEPARGQWEVPSGYLECGESLEQGAKRETYEETGVSVDPQQLALYSLVSFPDIEQVAITFHITLLEEPRLRRGSECLDVAFKSEREITREQLAWFSPAAASPGRIYREFTIGTFTSHRLITYLLG